MLIDGAAANAHSRPLSCSSTSLSAYSPCSRAKVLGPWPWTTWPSTGKQSGGAASNLSSPASAPPRQDLRWHRVGRDLDELEREFHAYRIPPRTGENDGGRRCILYPVKRCATACTWSLTWTCAACTRCIKEPDAGQSNATVRGLCCGLLCRSR